VSEPSRLTRPIALVVIVVMIGVSATGFYSIRQDLVHLQASSRDNILWSATQMEVELLRFERALAAYAADPGEAAHDELQERLDILWSRLNLAEEGRVGAILRHHDEGFGTLERIEAYLDSADRALLGGAGQDAAAAVAPLMAELAELQSAMRAYTLRVLRGDTIAAAQVRERMQASARQTGALALSTLFICLIALILISRESARQREIAALHLREAEVARTTSRAKSRFLTMMSHELRNPLNGILGPLALIRQSDVNERQVRLVERAQQSGRMMSRMLRSLLDYGDVQDDRLVLREDVFRPRALAEEVESALQDASAQGRAAMKVTVDPSVPDMVWGDPDRLAQIFIYLADYLLPATPRETVSLDFGYERDSLVGTITMADSPERPRWRLDILTGLSSESSRTFASDALAPLIALGLLRAAGGLLSLPEPSDGRRVVRVTVPARPVAFERIRVHVETRSAALETLYRGALKSDRVQFVDRPGEAADVVLIDSTTVSAGEMMQDLRARHPRALFVSLGQPMAPGLFDEVVELPNDLQRLRESVLGRLAS
jgi:signal transduction histidine kinase